MTTQDAAVPLPDAPDPALADASAAAVPLAASGMAGTLARALFEQSPLSTVVYDPAGRPTAVNAAFERLWRTTLAQVPADYRVVTDPQLEAAGVLPLVRRAFAGETVTTPAVRYDISEVTGEGRTTWTQGQFYPVLSPGGELAAVVLVHVDLTERMEAEQALRAEQERLRVALQDATFLAEAGRALNASLDVEATLRTVASHALPRLGAYCMLDLREGARMRRVAAAAPGSPHEAAARALAGYPLDLSVEANPIARVILSGQPALMAEFDRQVTRHAATTPEHGALIDSMAVSSVLSVPLRWNGETTGALTFVLTDGERHDAHDQPLAEELGRRAAAAIANARLHHEATEARDQLETQAMELELQSQQLQEQASELEVQREEMEQQVEELAALNTELGQSNAALASAEAFVRGVLESISDPFVVYDADWRFRYLNGAAAAVFRTAGHGGPERLVGRRVWDEYPQLVGTAIDREMRRAASERRPVAFEEFTAATGAWSEIRCDPMPDGGLAVVWKDVTPRRRAQEAAHFLSEAGAILASSLDYEATLSAVARLLVPQLGDWCVVQMADADGRVGQLAVAHADPARLELAREFNRLYPPRPHGDPALRRVLDTGEPVLVAEIDDGMLTAGARDERHLAMLRELGLRSAIIAPLAARGRVLGAITVIAAESGRRYTDDDVVLATEIGARAGLAVDNARLYAEAATARADAEAANRAKSEFLAVMSHELRTPLNAIGGYAELIEIGVHGPVTTAQGEALSRIQRSQRHLLSLINDVLNYARIEAARVHYDLAPLPVDEVLAGLEALVAPQVAARDLSYDYQPCDAALAMIGDEEKVRQVLLNLLSNAVKFTPAGGRVWVTASAEADGVHVNVADTGHGIPPDKLDAVFEPFVQLGRGLASTQEGTGLGLAISRDLARGMGGDLTAQSVLGEGSTFTLRLPRAPDAQVTPAP